MINRSTVTLTFILLFLIAGCDKGSSSDNPNGSDDVTATFTDPVFAQFCLDNFDKNKDGILSGDELESVTSIIALNLKAESLAGIEKFSNLTQLIVEEGELKVLDVSKNTKLSRIVCGSNKLTVLDFSKNDNLVSVSCSNSSLEELILPQGSNKLTSIGCSGTKLKTLDISRYTKLESLTCQNDPPFKLYVWPGFSKENLKECYLNPETEIIEKKQ